MADSRAKQLKEQGDKLFGEVGALRSFQQEVALNFYPERAQFTAGTMGFYDFASHLTTSSPLLIRRELGDAFSSMMRPSGADWFFMTTEQEEVEDRNSKLWLEDKTKVMRRAMYDIRSNFVASTKGGDHDWATFGAAVFSADLNSKQNGLLYKLYHPKDVVWREGYDTQICEVQRICSLAACIMDKIFKGNVHPNVAACLSPGKDKYKEFTVRHVMIAAEDYDTGTKWKKPWVSVWYDVENEFVMEEKERWDPYYVIPRWKMLDSSQYPFAPCTIIALPESRTLQAQALTLMEAGEKAVDPPMLGREGALRGDANVFAGGITWADIEGDQRLEDVLRVMEHDSSGIPYGLDMLKRSEDILARAFYLNRLQSVPPGSPEMTAYQVSQLVQEYIRNALPLFEPMEDQYNGQICEATFNLLLRGGAFGPAEDIPRPIQGANIRWRWESPLHQAIEQNKRAILQESVEAAGIAAQLDPSAPKMINAKIALRDVLNARTPQKWLRSEEEMEAIDAQDQKMRAVQGAVAGAGATAQVAEQVGKAGQAINAAQE